MLPPHQRADAFAEELPADGPIHLLRASSPPWAASTAAAVPPTEMVPSQDTVQHSLCRTLSPAAAPETFMPSPLSSPDRTAAVPSLPFVPSSSPLEALYLAGNLLAPSSPPAEMQDPVQLIALGSSMSASSPSTAVPPPPSTPSQESVQLVLSGSTQPASFPARAGSPVRSATRESPSHASVQVILSEASLAQPSPATTSTSSVQEVRSTPNRRPLSKSKSPFSVTSSRSRKKEKRQESWKKVEDGCKSRSGKSKTPKCGGPGKCSKTFCLDCASVSVYHS